MLQNIINGVYFVFQARRILDNEKIPDEIPLVNINELIEIQFIQNIINLIFKIFIVL